MFLAYWQDLTEAEIADTMDRARSTVHRTLVRARITGEKGTAMTTHLDPQVKSIFDEIVAHTPELGPTPTQQLAIAATESGRHRPWLTLAAATVVVAGLGGVAFVVWPDTEAPTAQPSSTSPFAQPSASVTEPSVTGPATEPTLFPALDDVPARLSATAIVQRVAAGPVWTEALLAHPVNGTITDTVAITVQAEPFDIGPMAGHPPTEAEVLGDPASVYDYGSTPVRDSSTSRGVPAVAPLHSSARPRADHLIRDSSVRESATQAWVQCAHTWDRVQSLEGTDVTG